MFMAQHEMEKLSINSAVSVLIEYGILLPPINSLGFSSIDESTYLRAYLRAVALRTLSEGILKYLPLVGR